MSSKVADLVHQYTTTTGTGNMLLTIIIGRRTFYDGFNTGSENKFYYTINSRLGGEWEVGIGYLQASNALVRETILASSNGGELVNFSSGIKDVVNDLPASEVFELSDLNLQDGDLVFYTNGNFERIPIGSENQTLGLVSTTNGLVIEWSDIVTNSITELENTINESLSTLNGLVSTNTSNITNLGKTKSPIGIAGCILSNNATDSNNDIDISAGYANDSTYAYQLHLSSTLTKQLDATWAVGSNAGGLDTGTKANSTWYHVFLIYRSDTGITDALFSTSATSPTMPTNYDYKRRIGAIRTNSSGNILQFTQFEDDFYYVTPIADLSAASITSTRANFTLSVPSGIIARPIAIYTGGINNSYVLITNPSLTDVTPALTDYTFYATNSITNTLQSYKSFYTNLSSQISIRSVSNVTMNFLTLGWSDPRGKY